MVVVLNVEVFAADEGEKIELPNSDVEFEVGNAVLLGSLTGFALNNEVVG